MRTASGADIIIDGDVVMKVHRLGTDPVELAARLAVAATLGGAADGCLLAPLDIEPQPIGDSRERRWCTRWPRVDTVPTTGEGLPWAAAGRLLARLHLAPSGKGMVIEHGAAARTARALLRLPDPPPPIISRAAAALPAQARHADSQGRPRTLVHGDFHLGQLGRRSGCRWVLIDVDDLGIGDPAWDLARPAGFWAAGLIPDHDWRAFLDAYRSAGGPAVPGSGDPWPTLEPMARAAVVQAAAVGVHRAIDETQGELLAACARMVAD